MFDLDWNYCSIWAGIHTRQFGGRKRNFNGEKLWARGYAVSTVGFEAAAVKNYIKNQEQLDGQGDNEIGSF